jgi:regulatory protein
MREKEKKSQISAYDQGIKYLSIRIHTIFELRNKLKRKNFSKDEIDETINRLIEQKYLNDDDFARTFVQNLVKYKSFGYYGIKNKLRQRGIDDKISDPILGEELDLETEKKIAQKAIGKTHNKDSMKLAQMLARKGFRNQVVSELIKLG